MDDEIQGVKPGGSPKMTWNDVVDKDLRSVHADK